MNSIEVSSIPKYTQYELSTLVRKKTIEAPEIFELTSLEQKILQQIIDGKISFKAKHYELISKILSIPIEELLEEEPFESSMHFRSNSGDNPELKEFVDSAQTLFGEFIIQSKLKGDI